MKITNRLNFPEALVKAIENDPYDNEGSDYSVSTLLEPPRIRALKIKHAAEIQEDVEDCLYRLYGQIAHGIIERSNTNELVEKRFFMEILGKRISAQIDNLSLTSGVLSDFKFSSAWTFKQKDPKPDWVGQLNIQLELLRNNGLDAKKIQIVGLIRDYSLRDARTYPDSYPQAPVVTMPIPMWTREQTISFIKMRIAAHEDAKERLPLCSDDERWAKPTQWAVVKNKRAISGGVQFSLKEAESVCSRNPGTRIEIRPGENVRCESYCSVKNWCDQYKNLTLGEVGEI